MSRTGAGVPGDFAQSIGPDSNRCRSCAKSCALPTDRYSYAASHSGPVFQPVWTSVTIVPLGVAGANSNVARVRSLRTVGNFSGASAEITRRFCGSTLTMVPPAVLPVKSTSQSPPGFNSTRASDQSQVMRPSRVVNAFHTSSTVAGTVTSKRSIFSGVAIFSTRTA